MLPIKPTLTRLIRYWSIPALLATVVFGTIYATAQQVVRQAANDPQIALAVEIASRQENGQNLQNLLPQDKIDLNDSLSTFVILYNEAAQPVNSSAQLDRQIPQLPSGVLETAKAKKLHTVTWEPKSNVRLATAVAYYDGKTKGYVLVGRSLKESERREMNVFYISVAGWLISLLLIFLVAILMPDKGLGAKTAAARNSNAEKPSEPTDVVQPKTPKNSSKKSK